MPGRNQNSYATILFTLYWNHGHTTHEEQFLARKINFWRDILPPALKTELLNSATGDCVTIDGADLLEITPHSSSKVRHIPARNFKLRLLSAENIKPKVGRFYPQGALLGIPGVHPQNLTPFRVIDLNEHRITADLNHPLAAKHLSLRAEILNIAEKNGDTGGRLTHWIEEICNWGPGMQAPLSNTRTDFVHPYFYKRADELNDTIFYSQPRLTGHIDKQASTNLQNLYMRFLKPGDRVLDLMSSMQSHLPEAHELDVMGLGLNMDEMRMNPLLSDRRIHDLNSNPELKFSNNFDAVVCSLSIEYLTDPLAVLEQAYSVLSPGGTLLIGISNRWFPTKVTQGWLELHEFERMGYLLQLSEMAGFNGDKGSISLRNDWRPPSDRHYMQTRGVSDPVYVVWCKKPVAGEFDNKQP